MYLDFKPEPELSKQFLAVFNRCGASAKNPNPLSWGKEVFCFIHNFLVVKFFTNINVELIKFAVW
jgi:hypothetical protein